MTETTITARDRRLAWACRLCPFCVVARWLPNSAYARKLQAMEKDCPACQAYRRVQEAEKNN